MSEMTILCDWIEDERRYRCRRCGFSMPRLTERPPRRECPAVPPSVIVRSEEAIAAIISVHCAPCPHYDAAARTCRSHRCGCASERAARYASLLRVGRCPEGRWR